MSSDSSRINPFDSVTDSLRKLLLAAGWVPANSRGELKGSPIARRRGGWNSFFSTFVRTSAPVVSDHPSRLVVDELYGIELESHRMAT